MTEFYGALAAWWPVISPVEDYADETDELRRLIQGYRPHARTLLELGSGGGHVAHHLARHFDCCLTDLSADMLALSRQLNSACEHVQSDPRSLDLGRTFDVVLAHDAIDYMLTEDDLARVCNTAWRHLEPGGLVVLVPDTVAETFEPGTDVSGSDAPDGRAARLFEWAEPLRPGATQAAVHYSFLLRERDGGMRTVYERHDCGVFPTGTWTRLLAERGFHVDVVVERTDDEQTPRRLFVGQRPG
ncbi:MAG: class I SAM-dependent methyltransferase [Acidobacteria bacterium]|nr:class I SAM-dependent methyltransferase [Acidobacteriota bacterium]